MPSSSPTEVIECPLCSGTGELTRGEILDRLGVKDFARVAQLSAEEAFRLLQNKHDREHQTAWSRFETELAKRTAEIREQHKDEIRLAHSEKETLNFESVNPAVPRFSGMRPYDQLPFQFSVHVLREHGVEPEHHEFLAIDASDPRHEFTATLCSVLGDSGSIAVYNAQFEAQRLSELAVHLPEFAERIGQIKSRLWDLLPVVRNNVYHPKFAGSYSLKNVLPALVPEMSYAGMQVADGQAAGLAWEALVRGNVDGSDGDGDKLKRALLDYCRQDTLALVKLLDKLQNIPSNS
jgi:hypothetical protein